MKSRHKVVYVLLTLLLLAACRAAAPVQEPGTIPGNQDEVPRITPQEVKALQDAGKRVVIADARSLESYELQHIVGAISVPALEVAEHVDKLPKQAHIVFYCT
jgi:hypothetical protein